MPRRRGSKRPPVDVETRLLDWGPKGSVLADIEGHRALVDRGLPGELVKAEVRTDKSPWHGVAREVMEASSHRIQPSCRHFLEGCGGCQWQHMSYDAQIETKRRQVDAAMANEGLDTKVGVAHAMDDPWRYRRTAAIAIGWEAGFRPRGRRGIVEVHDCPISHPLIGALSHALNRVLRAQELPNYHGKVWLDCTVVGPAEDHSLQVLIQGIAGLTEESHPELPEVARRVSALPGVSSVAFRHRDGRPRGLVGPLIDSIEVGPYCYRIPAGSFFQTNPIMLTRVVERMRGLLVGRDVRRGADIYGGVGTLGLPLADLMDRLTLVELDPLAVEAARETASRWGLTNIDFAAEHAERALPSLEELDLVIVDPPRSGLGPSVASTLLERRASRILYLSCAPPSLARDLAELTAGGYRVTSLEMFDFYPQTYHVESLAVLELCA